MRIRYFRDTDTLYIEFNEAPVVETQELDDNTLIDFDAKENMCCLTIEHVTERSG